MAKTLGGSVFIHNALEFDYCVRESLSSLCAVCDQVIALDAESTDGTVDALLEFAKGHPNLKVVTGAKWECAPNYSRLAMLANEAKSHLKTDWHFMLQADEVLHESSFPFIRKAMAHDRLKSCHIRRLNFFGDYNHYIKIEQPQHNKPCGDEICRLATIENNACGDAESICVDPTYGTRFYLDDIVIYHYGYVRADEHHIKKTIAVQSWFWGEGSQPDSRVVEMDKEGGKVYDWRRMKSLDMLSRLTKSHPRFAWEYVKTRQALKTIPVGGA